MRGHVHSLGMQRDQLAGKVRDDHSGSIGADHDHCLLIQCVHDGPGPGGVPAGSLLLELRIDPCFASMLQLRRGGPSREDFQDGVVFQPRSEDPFQWRRIWVNSPRIRLLV